MRDPLFIILAQGIATRSTPYRAGARHALMLYAKGSDTNVARSLAVAKATEAGWLFIEVCREKQVVTDLSVIDDDEVKSAAEAALQSGFSMIVYRDEIVPNG